MASGNSKKRSIRPVRPGTNLFVLLNCDNIEKFSDFCLKNVKFGLKDHITIHMPQRSSKIVLVRLTANRNA